MAGMVDQPSAVGQHVLMLDYVDKTEQYIPARKTVKPRPQPRQTTVADFMVNKFQALEREQCESSSRVSIRSSSSDSLTDFARCFLSPTAQESQRYDPTRKL